MIALRDGLELDEGRMLENYLKITLHITTETCYY